MASTRASGTNAVACRTMRGSVLGLRVVLAGGTVVSTGGVARKSSAGYDFKAMFVGSEGTLGIITEAGVRLYGIPGTATTAVVPFPSLAAAWRSVSQARYDALPRRSSVAARGRDIVKRRLCAHFAPGRLHRADTGRHRRKWCPGPCRRPRRLRKLPRRVYAGPMLRHRARRRCRNGASLRLEHANGVTVIEAIKMAPDPGNILNPGKVL